jgi:hypothetical protein
MRFGVNPHECGETGTGRFLRLRHPFLLQRFARVVIPQCPPTRAGPFTKQPTAGRPLGPEEFVARLKAYLGRRLKRVYRSRRKERVEAANAGYKM